MATMSSQWRRDYNSQDRFRHQISSSMAGSKWLPVHKVQEQFTKNEAEEWKYVWTISLSYVNAKSTQKLSLTFNNVEKTKHENFNFVIIFLRLISITQKLCGACEQYTYQLTAMLLGIFLFWFGAAHELRLVSYGLKTILQRCLAFSFINFWGFCSHNSGVACIVKPHLDY